MMLSFVTLLAQGDAAQPQGGPLSSGLIMPIALIVMFYFLLIRPQQRQRKDLEKRIAALQKGDEVVTASGIHAIVHHIKERTVMLKVAEGVTIEFDKHAVATVLKKEASSAA